MMGSFKRARAGLALAALLLPPAVSAEQPLYKFSDGTYRTADGIQVPASVHVDVLPDGREVVSAAGFATNTIGTPAIALAMADTGGNGGSYSPVLPAGSGGAPGEPSVVTAPPGSFLGDLVVDVGTLDRTGLPPNKRSVETGRSIGSVSTIQVLRNGSNIALSGMNVEGSTIAYPGPLVSVGGVVQPAWYDVVSLGPQSQGYPWIPIGRAPASAFHARPR